MSEKKPPLRRPGTATPIPPPEPSPPDPPDLWPPTAPGRANYAQPIAGKSASPNVPANKPPVPPPIITPPPRPNVAKKSKTRSANSLPLLAGASGAGIVILTLVGALWWASHRGGKSTTVVDAKEFDKSTASVAAPELPPDPEATASEPVPTANAESLPASPPPTKPPEPQLPVPEPKKPANEPKSEPAKPATKPEPKPAAKPATKKSQDKPAPKSVTAKPKDSPAVAKTETPADPPNPLRGLPTAVTLPSRDARDGKDLGPVELASENEFVRCRLLTAVSGGRSAAFSLTNANRGNSAHEWDIKYKSTEGVEFLIARLSLQDKKLKFQWTPSAATQDGAALLANCALDVQLGSDSRRISLREPQKLPPLIVGGDKVQSSVKTKLEAAPPSSTLRVRIVQLDGFPKHKLEAKQFSSTNRSLPVTFDGLDGELLQCKLESGTVGGVELKWSGQFRSPINGAMQPISIAQVSKAIDWAEEKQKTTATKAAQVTKALGGDKKLKGKATRAARGEIMGANSESLQAKLLVTKLQSLKSLAESFKSGRIHYEVVFPLQSTDPDSPLAYDLVIARSGG